MYIAMSHINLFYIIEKTNVNELRPVLEPFAVAMYEDVYNLEVLIPNAFCQNLTNRPYLIGCQ